MSFLKKLGTGLKVALGIAIKLDEAHIIKVKELSKAKTIGDIVGKAITEARKPSGGMYSS